MSYRTRHEQIERRPSRHMAFRIFFFVAAFGQVWLAIAALLNRKYFDAYTHGVLVALCVQWGVER